MDADEARKLSVITFSESVEAEVTKIVDEIKQNLRRGEIDYHVLGAWGDSVDISTFKLETHLLSRYPREYMSGWKPNTDEKNETGYARILRERYSDDSGLLGLIVDMTFISQQNILAPVYDQLYFGEAIDIEIRMRGYQTEWCNGPCCPDEPSDDQYLWINWHSG